VRAGIARYGAKRNEPPRFGIEWGIPGKVQAVTDLELFRTLQETLGRQYRLERELGRGGMGVVFLATDVALERPVAVKVIHPDLIVNRGLVTRFLAEARLVARIRHPNIVAVHAAGDANGHLFYVMDFHQGETLRQRLRREGRLPVGVALSIAADLALALDAAAAAGVVHRDLKPENILLEGPPEASRALLADFGIARLVDGVDGPTGPTAVMGTPAYMSPEQAAGEGIDARSDLYSLGIVTYEMLTGEPPFTGTPRVIVSRQLMDPPPPLSQARPELPVEVTRAVMRALEKVPEARWQSGAAYRRALLDEPTPVDPIRPGKRRRVRRAALALTLLLLAGAGLGLGLRARSAPAAGTSPRQTMLVLPFDNLRDDPALAWLHDGSVNMLAMALSQWRDLAVIDQDRVHDLLAQASVSADAPIGLTEARRLARRAGAGTVVLGDYARAGDSLRLTARTYDVASGTRLEVVEAAGRAAPDVRPLFDELASRLLDLSGAPAGRHSLSQVTTESLEAYRAYLVGLGHLNQWELNPAEAAFRRAVAFDSTFSLGYYKLSLTRGWILGAADSMGRNAVLQASRFAGRLPERERGMIDAYRAMLDGEYERSQQLYRSLLAADSIDADAWYGLGDALFHDTVAGSTAAGMTRALKAFRRALTLDSRYALAYEHITFLLNSASNRNGTLALIAPDSLVETWDKGRAPLDSLTRTAAVGRARAAAVQTARSWVASQPATPRAHHALFEAYFAGEEWDNASREVAELARLLPSPGRNLSAYLEARVRFARGDARSAAALVRSTTASFGGRAPALPDFGREFVSDVMSGANTLAYHGDLDGAAEVIALGDAIRRATQAPEAPTTIWDQDDVWQWSRLAQLYSAAGGPSRQLRRVWSDLAGAARRAPEADRASVAGAGAAAAVGLLLGAEADGRPLAELETLTGRSSAPAVRALAALARGDRAVAQRVLADSLHKREHVETKSSAVYLGFAWNDPRPLEAEARYQLGDYRGAIEQLRTFDESQLWRRGFDSRWGIMGRVHLLRGLAYERLGEMEQAGREFREVVAAWQGADQPLLTFVQQAQAGLARLKGVVEGRRS
jgi:eukaryotic-like serine/threonine-protein kinase